MRVPATACHHYHDVETSRGAPPCACKGSTSQRGRGAARVLVVHSIPMSPGARQVKSQQSARVTRGGVPARCGSQREQGHPGGCPWEEQRLQRLTGLALRGLSVAPLCAAWPWPRHPGGTWEVVEQDHRAVKRVTRPMVGLQSFHAAQDTLMGMELMHRIKKRPMVVEDGGAGRTLLRPDSVILTQTGATPPA